MVQTVRSSEEESTVLGAAVGGVQQAAIEDELVDCQDRQRCVPLVRIVDVRREAQALVLTLKGLLFVDGHGLDTPILAEIFVATQGIFLSHVRREANDIERVPLQDAHRAQLLLQSLLL